MSRHAETCGCNGVEHVAHAPVVRFAREVLKLNLRPWQEGILEQMAAGKPLLIARRAGVKSMRAVLRAHIAHEAQLARRARKGAAVLLMLALAVGKSGAVEARISGSRQSRIPEAATMSSKKSPSAARDLKPASYNPRKITAAAEAALGRSLAKFGDLSSVVFNVRTQTLVCGHQRLKTVERVARIVKTKHKDEHGTVALGYIETRDKGRLVYREVDWDEATEKAANIAANAHGGEFDDAKAADLVEELLKGGFDLTLLGFDDTELDALLEGKAEAAARPDEDELPEPVSGPAITKLGDLWRLGAHRLLCGDSTSKADVGRLMGKERAACVFTDPPYGVSYEAKSGKFAIIENDDKTHDALLALLAPALTRAAEFSKDTAGIYVWHASSTREEFAHALKAAGLMERQYLIWAKHGLVLGHSDYRWAHEPCFYASKQGFKPDFYGARDQASVWRAALKAKAGVVVLIGPGVVLRDGKGGQVMVTARVPKGKKLRQVRLQPGQAAILALEAQENTVWEVGHDRDYVHPTQKPVELARRALSNSTTPEQIVLDLFGGSGSTLIAAEALNRRARLMELDPKYCDAIVRRWERFTGQTAIKEKKENTA